MKAQTPFAFGGNAREAWLRGAGLGTARAKGIRSMRVRTVKAGTESRGATAGQERQWEAEQGEGEGLTPTEEAERRVERLDVLLQLRKLYRTLVEAKEGLEKGGEEIDSDHDDDDDHGEEEEEEEGEEQGGAKRLEKRLRYVEEMQGAAERLQTQLGAIEGRLGAVFDDGEEAERAIKEEALDAVERVNSRVNEHAKELPGGSIESARKALESERARKKQHHGDHPGPLNLVGPGVRRAEEAMQSGLEQLRKMPMGSILQVAHYARGLWARLNGREEGSQIRMPSHLEGLPDPSQRRREDRRKRVADISMEMAGLEKELNEASKRREGRLRKAGALDRARNNTELAGMDERVNTARRALAVKALQREMAQARSAIEEEAADVSEGSQLREGEVAFLVAEYGALDRSLARVEEAIEANRSGPSEDADLADLARDVPELKQRAGAAEDGEVSLTWEVGVRRARRAAQDAWYKLKDGAQFCSRGVSLLGSDLSAAMRLIGRAAIGQPLNRREVRSLRRTARDVLTFAPFVAILITPMTPVGHVLVFSFIQRYFPGLFPSQFTERRQSLLRKSEGLNRNEAGPSSPSSVSAADPASSLSLDDEEGEVEEVRPPSQVDHDGPSKVFESRFNSPR